MSRGARRLSPSMLYGTVPDEPRECTTILPPRPTDTDIPTIESVVATNARLERIRVAFSVLSVVQQESITRVIEGMVVANAEREGV